MKKKLKWLIPILVVSILMMILDVALGYSFILTNFHKSVTNGAFRSFYIMGKIMEKEADPALGESHPYHGLIHTGKCDMLPFRRNRR